MANKRGKAIDNTHLSLDVAEERGFIHRDYIAHALRWTHVIKYLNAKSRYSTAQILDIGCGREVPLAKTMYSSRMIAKDYLGVDVNKLEVPDMFHTGKFPIRLISGDITELDLPKDRNVITCFEVIEHIEPEHVHRVLDKIKEVMTDDGVAFISTPVFNGKAAANHVNEMTYLTVGKMLEDAGFEIEERYGTFASITDYKDKLDHWQLEPAFKALREYYDVNFLAVIFAPLFPRQSRNVIWRVRHTERHFPSMVNPFKFPQWNNIEQPWSSSEHWRDCQRER